jgi:hypothetical protein
MNRLSKQLAAMKDKDGDKFLQVLDARTGQPRGSLLLESEKGSLFFWQVFAVNGSVVTVDSTKHVRVYSLVSGEQVGIVSGSEATATRTSGLLCVESEEGKLTIYDLASMRERDQFVFAGPIAFARFSDDGKRLFVLTRSQYAYVLDVSSSAINPK